MFANLAHCAAVALRGALPSRVAPWNVTAAARSHTRHLKSRVPPTILYQEELSRHAELGQIIASI